MPHHSTVLIFYMPKKSIQNALREFYEKFIYETRMSDILFINFFIGLDNHIKTCYNYITD